MFTRVVQRKRPRRPAFLFLTAAATAALLVSGVALALISDGPGTYDIRVPNSGSSLTADLGNATVTYIGSDSDTQSSGTGLFDPFLRIQGSPTEEGYNTCSQKACGGNVTEFETKTGSWTKPILASAIPVVDCDGTGPGTTLCWELFVDINEGNNAKHISLNEVEIWLSTDPNITGYDDGFADATQVYDFTGDILIHDVNQGSGRGDLLYLVPVQEFDSGDWFVLYSEWGTTGTLDGISYSSEGGFEEWKVRKAPNLAIVKTADALSVNAGSSIGFTITVTNGGAADATGVTVNDLLPSGTGVDWSIDSQSPAGSCSISGSPPSETLTCGPLTLASGGGSLTVHVTSATTAASCGTYNNTANLTSTNAGSGSSSASTAVNCAAIRILKNSTKGGAVANAGAVFAVDGPDAGTTADFSVTDASPASGLDEDGDVGEVCVSGLVPGATYTVNETSPPSGYGGASQLNVTVVAVNGNCSTTGLNAATFSNAPLGEFIIDFNDLGSGETSAKIDCSSPTAAISPTPVDGDPLLWNDNIETYTNLPGGDPAIVYTCTISIDP